MHHPLFNRPKSNHNTFSVAVIMFIILVTIGLAIGLVVCIYTIYDAYNTGRSNISIDLNGIVTTRCMQGYQFVVGANGNVRQVMDEFGHGVRCE